MTKHLIFPLFVTLCFSLCFITIGDLFSQTNRGMKIKVHTKDGQETSCIIKTPTPWSSAHGNYTHDWRRLPGALQDVRGRRSLEEHGFRVMRKKDLTKAEFDRAFVEFVYTYGKDKDNRLLFYYAGHGHTLPSATGEKLGYLVMVDTPSPDKDMISFQLNSIDMTSFVDESKKIQARHTLFVFDSCFSGTLLNLNETGVLLNTFRTASNIRFGSSSLLGSAGEKVPDRSVFKQEFLDLIQGRAREPIS